MSVVHAIKCDNCCAHMHSTNSQTLDHLLEDANALGWMRTQLADLCPICTRDTRRKR